MLTKTQVIESFKDLPEEISADDLIERILFLQAVEEGLQQSARGDVVSLEDAKERLPSRKS